MAKSRNCMPPVCRVDAKLNKINQLFYCSGDRFKQVGLISITYNILLTFSEWWVLVLDPVHAQLIPVCSPCLSLIFVRFFFFIVL